MGIFSKNLSKIAVKEARDEITDYTIYEFLSKTEEDKKLKNIFSKFAIMEKRHYLFWKRYCGNISITEDAAKVRFVLLLRKLFGATFVIRYLENTEKKAVSNYESLRNFVPRNDRKQFARIIKDEEEHEFVFSEQSQTAHVRYISFVVLGLADALVEIAGIHAGSLGIYNSTLLTGLAGIVAGAAASISMASAAYAQSKQGFQGSSTLAAAYTGISYFISAVFLATPYFFTSSMITAIGASLFIGFLIIAFISWYNSVFSRTNAVRDFIELAGVMVAATLVLYIFGGIIRALFGITV